MGRVPVIVLVVALGTSSCAGDPPQGSESPPPSVPPGLSPTPTAATPPLSDVRVRLDRVATLDQPVGMAVRGGDSALYIAEKTGVVVAVRGGRVQTVLDLAGQVSQGGEQGLLGLAFSPDGAFLYVNLTDLEGDTRVLEYAMQGGRADPASRREVLFVDQPYSNHNGGNLAFGPDGYLYIGLGDGGSAGDPMGNAQSLGVLLGKMLRIDPRPSDGDPYRTPPDNPFAGREGARPEIWAYGLRNPWRYSFDRESGDLWIGDVGQGAREEIDFQPAASTGGENYGWDRLEGTLPFEGQRPSGAVPPVHEYGRALGASVIGGYVYRGSAIPDLRGTYVYSDFYNSALWGLRVRDGRVVEKAEIGVEVPNLASFGEDHSGELYALSLSGDVFRLAP